MYGEASQEILKNINPYIKKGEVPKVSTAVEYCGNLYRKVVFQKSFVGKLRGKEEEFLFINEKDEILNKKQVQRELVKLFYYYDIFFDEDNKISIYKTLQSESEIKKDENDYKEAEIGLKIVGERLKKHEEKEGLKKVLGILKQVPELRKSNNEKLNELVNIIENMKKEKKAFNEECLSKIYPVYKEALMLNFKKIKVIYPGGQYYNNFKKMAEKTRRRQSLTFRTRHTTNLIKANYIMGYFEKVINTYSKILDMTEANYMKFLKEAEKNNIDTKINFIRSL